jgi:orotate phosphoribosyltransferase
MVALFSYEFEVSKQLFDENNIDLFTLSNYDFVLQHALKSDYIKSNELLLLEQWKLSPQSWQP